MPSSQKYSVFIVVHKGDPLDIQKYRHTAIYLVPDANGSTYYCHVRGSTGEFQYEKRRNYKPQNSQSFAKLIPVGRTKVATTGEELTDHVKRTRVKNDDPEFNCQTWVDDSVRRMAHAGLLDEEEYENGISEMLDATMEAEDEPQA